MRISGTAGIAAVRLPVQLTEGSSSQSGVSGRGLGSRKLRPTSIVGLRPQKRTLPPVRAKSLITAKASSERTSEEGMMSVW